MDSQEQGTNLDSPWLSPLILTYLISWVYYLKFYLYMQFPLGKKQFRNTKGDCYPAFTRSCSPVPVLPSPQRRLLKVQHTM